MASSCSFNPLKVAFANAWSRCAVSSQQLKGHSFHTARSFWRILPVQSSSWLQPPAIAVARQKSGDDISASNALTDLCTFRDGDTGNNPDDLACLCHTGGRNIDITKTFHYLWCMFRRLSNCSLFSFFILRYKLILPVTFHLHEFKAQ